MTHRFTRPLRRSIASAARAAAHAVGGRRGAAGGQRAGAVAQPGTVSEQLLDNELPRPTITLANGRKLKLSTSNCETARTTPVRADRKKIFDAYFGSLKAFEGTLGANLNAHVLSHIFNAKSRKYANALDAALFDDAMPIKVYDTLIAQANAGLPVLHRYLGLRKKVLGINGPLAYTTTTRPWWRRPRPSALTSSARKH